jgi:L-fuculose-phosphate aldolase
MINKRNYVSDEEAKKIICDIGHKMYMRGYVSANDGNITLRVGDNALWATPTGVSKGDLSPEMLIKVDLLGNVLEGTWEPTSETQMHLRAYWENDDIVSTCHTHSLYSMIFATAGIELDVSFSPEPTGIVGTVPVAPYGTPGTVDLADSIKPFVKGYKMCLLSNHGAISWGTKPLEAWHRMEALEAYCQLCYHQEFVVKRSRILSEEQIKTLFIRHETGVTEFNRLKGVEKETNTEPAVKLSELRKELQQESSLQITEDILEALAGKIAERVLDKLNTLIQTK